MTKFQCSSERQQEGEHREWSSLSSERLDGRLNGELEELVYYTKWMTVEVYSILYAEEKWKTTGTSSVTSSGSTLPVAGEPGKLCLVIFDQVWVQMRSHDIGISREDSWPARTSILYCSDLSPRCRRACHINIAGLTYSSSLSWLYQSLLTNSSSECWASNSKKHR